LRMVAKSMGKSICVYANGLRRIYVGSAGVE
jgi:hypothetical protein